MEHTFSPVLTPSWKCEKKNTSMQMFKFQSGSQSTVAPNRIWLLTFSGIYSAGLYLRSWCPFSVAVSGVALPLWQRGLFLCFMDLFSAFPTAAPQRTATQLEGWFCHQSDPCFIRWLWEVKDACSKNINHLWIWNNFTKGMGKQAASHRWVVHLNVVPHWSLLPSMPALGKFFCGFHFPVTSSVDSGGLRNSRRLQQRAVMLLLGHRFISVHIQV